MKKHFILFLFVTFAIQAWSQSVTILEAAGWMESVYVRWQPVIGADSYNVYYTGNGLTDKRIDTQLIRSYGTYFRADIPGLKAGTYKVKVVPVISGIEGAPATTNDLTVLPHDRTGFAFHGGRIPGAYKADGTPKDGAVIIYISQNTKNTVSMNITGANANPCVGLQNILYGIKKGKDTRPFIIRLIGNITDMTIMEGGDMVIENANNTLSYVTFEGVGSDAVANGWGVRLKAATNVEVRNLGFMNCNSTAGDDIGLQQDNDHIWIHNCDLFYGNAGSDADQIKGDGALDNKGTTYVTLSYNHFWDNGKASLLGLSEDTTIGLYITYHHNWFDHSDSRHPRVRFYSTHIYNNYYDGNAKYGVGSTMGSSVFVEGNYFRNCKRPMLTSMQGTDVWDEVNQKNNPGTIGTFSDEAGGTIKAFNNTFDYTAIALRFVAYGDPNPLYNIDGKISSVIDFDAYVAATRDEQVPATVKSFLGANTYNNFDTNAALYVKNLVIDAPEVAKTKTIQYAGRVEGGDLKFTFNNAVDDPAYLVNTTIKTALTNYIGDLVSVQGETVAVPSSQTLTSSTDNNQSVAPDTAIEPMIFTWGGDATDATVSGLPASGISFMKDAETKTITISGTPTTNISFIVTTSGTLGTPVTLSGTITLTTGGSTPSDVVHNFTLSGKISSFFNITGNLSTSYGTASYDGLTLTQCLKMESSTNISFTTTEASTLTLVFGSSYTGTINIDGTVISPSGGIIARSIAAGTHTILKGSGTNNLFYMKIVYNYSTNIDQPEFSKITIYPNPVTNKLYISANVDLNKIEIFTLTGQKIYQINRNVPCLDLSHLQSGNYLLKLFTREGIVSKLIIKK